LSIALLHVFDQNERGGMMLLMGGSFKAALIQQWAQ
jgi:hypothetical protein